jgi:hypothetical protein
MLEPSDAPRECGDCSLCCTLLRVDALRKLGGVDCVHQDVAGPGCAIHAHRPQVCRRYACLWRGGSLDAADRPDRLGAVLDLVSRGASVQLEIHEAAPGVFDRSARLQAIAAQFRASMQVRISDVADVLDADRPVRILLPGGDEEIVRGEWTESRRRDGAISIRRLPLLERLVRWLMVGLRRLRVKGYRARSAQPRLP